LFQRFGPNKTLLSRAWTNVGEQLCKRLTRWKKVTHLLFFVPLLKAQVGFEAFGKLGSNLVNIAIIANQVRVSMHSLLYLWFHSLNHRLESSVHINSSSVCQIFSFVSLFHPFLGTTIPAVYPSVLGVLPLPAWVMLWCIVLIPLCCVRGEISFFQFATRVSLVLILFQTQVLTYIFFKKRVEMVFVHVDFRTFLDALHSVCSHCEWNHEPHSNQGVSAKKRNFCFHAGIFF
jgi:hypothetical protein